MKTIAKVVIILLSVLLIMSACLAMIGSSDIGSTDTTKPTTVVEIDVPEEVVAEAVPPTTVSTPTLEPTPEPTTPEEMVIDALVKEVGKKPSRYTAEFNEVGNLLITFEVSNNFTNDWIVEGTRIDVMHIIETIASLDVEYDTLMITAHTSLLLDEFGNNIENEEVVWVKYSKETVDKINWSKFQTKNTYGIAEEGYVHPLFKVD